MFQMFLGTRYVTGFQRKSEAVKFATISRKRHGVELTIVNTAKRGGKRLPSLRFANVSARYRPR